MAARLFAGGLYPILDLEAAAAGGHDVVECARGFAALGLEVQQLRAKTASGAEMVRMAERLMAVVPRLIINDRADVAALTGAAGIHLGQDDLPAAAAAGLGPAEWLVGVSTHTPAQADAALAPGPFRLGYLAMGPIFPTRSKLKPDAVVGVQSLTALRARCPVPLVAIGGIELASCGQVWAAGADAIAIIGGLWQAPNPVAAAEQFLLAFSHVSCHSARLASDCEAMP